MNVITAITTSTIPDPTPVVPAEAGGLLTVLNWASGIGLVLGVLGVIIVGIGMVIQPVVEKAANQSPNSAGS